MAFINTIPSLRRQRLPPTQPRRPNNTLPRMTTAQNQTIQGAWPTFAERMKSENKVPPVEDWHYLFDIAISAKEDPKMAIWLINLMRETGLKPTTVTYEKVLQLCALKEDRVSAFHLVEHMWNDKVLLGDISLPEGMEQVLRKILPPEAFE